MRKVLGLLCISAVTALVFCSRHDRLQACAVAPFHNDFVSIQDEDALIVWDAENQTEHFLRKARFQHLGDGKGFGFLVPTPTQPTLTEADPELFATLGQFTVAPIERVINYLPRPKAMMGSATPDMDTAASPAPNAMVVLEQKTIAGYDAAVLKATDVTALTTWLKEHEYEFNPEMEEWLGEYVKNEWIITAFKVSASSTGSTSLGLVRLSFQTPTPFYPYREPKNNPKDTRANETRTRRLRLFVLASERMDGTLGKEGPLWPGVTQWSDQLFVAQQSKLNQRLKVERLEKPGMWWLTEFQDDSSPRPGTDEVFFRKSDSQDALHRKPVLMEETVYIDTIPGDQGFSVRPEVVFSSVILFVGGGILGGLITGLTLVRIRQS